MTNRLIDGNGDVWTCNSCGTECYIIKDESDIMIGHFFMYCPHCDKIFDSITLAVDNPPKSCSCCPNAIWEKGYKWCKSLDTWIHPCFRTNARLNNCPLVKIK